jgi:uncharacterized protein
VTGPEPFVARVGGVRLAGELTRHAGDRRGLVLVRTPYDARRHRDLAASLARRGYDCLVQDVRGRHGSEGVWRPYDDEAADGVATLAAARHAGLAGPAVLYGASYAAHTALETAAAAGPAGVAAVVALVPAIGLHETAYDTDGVAQHRDRLGWWATHGFTRTDQAPLPADVLRTAEGIAQTLGPFAAAHWLGWDDHQRDRWRRLWEASPVDLGQRYGDVGVPILVVTGDHDPFDGHARRLAAAWGQQRGPRAALLSGAWGHDLALAGPDAATVLGEAGGPGARILDWLAGAGPAPGTERRLDRVRRRWVDQGPGLQEGAA